MAITSHERVGKALDLLKGGDRTLLEREIKARYGDGWAAEVILNDTRFGGGRGDSLQDVAIMLVITR